VVDKKSTEVAKLNKNSRKKILKKEFCSENRIKNVKEHSC